jgi:Flp pilus assembly protein protease CpaA
MIFLFKLILTGALFLLASRMDLKTRTVENWVWLVLGMSGVGLAIIEISDAYHTMPFNWFTGHLALMLVSVIACLIIALIAYFILHAGGADAKAIICLGLIYPSDPFLLFLSLFLAFLCSIILHTKYKSIPFIPPLTLGYLETAALFVLGGRI